MCNETDTNQGYLTDRVMNQSLRKLLVETRSIRPRYEPDLAYSDIDQLSRYSSTASSGVQWPKRTSSLFSLSTWPRSYAARVISKDFSNAQRHSAPGFSRMGALQERKSSAPVRGVSLWPTISDSDSPLRLKRTPITIPGKTSFVLY
jgi:hypothetical protein